MQKLPNRISVYVPSTRNTNESIDSSAIVLRVLGFLSSLCGGATSQSAIGAWQSESCGLVTESVTIVWSACVLTLALRHALVWLAKDIKQELTQDSVAIEIDGALILV